MLVAANELLAVSPDTLWIANPAGAVTSAEPSAGLPRFSIVRNIDWPFPPPGTVFVNRPYRSSRRPDKADGPSIRVPSNATTATRPNRTR